MRFLKFALSGFAALVAFSTLAADAQDIVVDQNTVKWGIAWVCKNQDYTSSIIWGLAVHFGASLISARLKKWGITADAPWYGWVVQLIRFAALDLKAPPQTIANQAAILDVKGALPTADPAVVAKAVAKAA